MMGLLTRDKGGVILLVWLSLLATACATVSGQVAGSIHFLAEDQPAALVSGSNNPAEFVPPTFPPAEAARRPAAQGTISGEAEVEQVDVRLVESTPVQVQVLVRGSLPDGCTTLDRVSQQREGMTFLIRLTTTRPAEAMCTQALVPFEELIPLDVTGLPGGTYTVNVNGVTNTFVLGATDTPTLSPAPVAEASLSSCPRLGPGQLIYTNPMAHYCLLYPDYLQVNQVSLDLLNLSSPLLREGPEPVTVTLTIRVDGPVAGRSLVQVVNEIVGSPSSLPITRTPTTLGNKPAEMVTGLPGRVGARHLFASYNGVIYHLTLTPVDNLFPQATAVAETVWQMLLQSFTFLPISPADGTTWQQVTLPEAGLTFEVPSTWPQLSQTEWSPDGTGMPRIGVNWMQTGPNWAPTAMLPNHARALAQQPVDLGWASGLQYQLEVTDPAVQGGRVVAFETHVIAPLDQPLAYDFYASGRTPAELAQVEAAHRHMLDSASLVATVAAPGPASCSPGPDTRLYVNSTDGYCLLYPAYFPTAVTNPGLLRLVGPPVGAGIEPVVATLMIRMAGPAAGRSPMQIVNSVTSPFPGLPITRTLTIVGSEMAETVEGLPGRTGSRQLFVVHGDRVYHLILSPVDKAFPQAAADGAAAWQTVTRSIAFLP